MYEIYQGSIGQENKTMTLLTTDWEIWLDGGYEINNTKLKQISRHPKSSQVQTIVVGINLLISRLPWAIFV